MESCSDFTPHKHNAATGINFSAGSSKRMSIVPHLFTSRPHWHKIRPRANVLCWRIRARFNYYVFIGIPCISTSSNNIPYVLRIIFFCLAQSSWLSICELINTEMAHSVGIFCSFIFADGTTPVYYEWPIKKFDSREQTIILKIYHAKRTETGTGTGTTSL